MIKISIVTLGKDKERWLTEGIEHYLKLLRRYALVEMKILPSPKMPAALSPAEVKKKEADIFEKEFQEGLFIALSEHGEKKDSKQFARFLQEVQNRARGTVYFLIGGPHGLDDRLLKRADHILSLSGMTFSHQLVRLILLEQLYRGFSILHGTAYHK
ncbi:MAG: 23S rRNA (pseudouridine(1915)-N(3))-methyltransferase RlmH [candidate division Zixibacteria bacterium]|nr:23S rRNA (pseudouridine(1915)-N(3))-methyltransferase RlmH [candidate division Zixibacteria bacterium]MDD5424865.1 23S rRNA (pseudouridine(1915)-N(3))-methyltransferase RlmH [candidate division Zixibacteria bacterium]